MLAHDTSEPDGHRYGCHTEVAPGRRCGLPTWGDSPYCRWHYEAIRVFTVRIIMVMEDPRNKHIRGTPFRARYDPEFANTFWRSCHTRPRPWINWAVRAVVGAAFLMGALVFARVVPWPVEWVPHLYFGPAAIAIVGFLGMFGGSTELLYPKLIPLAALGLVAFQLAEWLTFGFSADWAARASAVAVAALFLLYMSPLIPPRSRWSFDARDKMQPPM